MNINNGFNNIKRIILQLNLLNGGQLPGFLRRYKFDIFDNKCCICGWSKVNPYTNTIPLEIDHIDGNSENNLENNLRR